MNAATRTIAATATELGARDEAARCFHCNEPLTAAPFVARIGNHEANVCCEGCRAVAELISGAGLADYYSLRENASVRPEPADADAWATLAQPDVAAQFTHRVGELDSVVLAVDGLRCAACGWLIDRILCGMSGVQEASTNGSIARTYVSWHPSQATLADVCRRIAQLGYRPQPLQTSGTTDGHRDERRDALKRLAVAGLGMMQVMMFAVATYSADLAGETIDATLHAFFRLVSLLVATPVMFYAAAPIFASAARNMRTRTLGMDVPVSIALLLAYAASAWNTFFDAGGQVYFDSVAMFVFFLTLARFVQMTVRQRTVGATEALARQLPSCAHRTVSGVVEDVPLSALRAGDTVLVRHGEVLPADGELIDVATCIDESLLSGEPLPVQHASGDRLAAGTLNLGAPFHLRVTAVASGTVLSHIASLQQRALAQRPAAVKTADVAAARFLRYVLVGAGLTCWFWLSVDPSRAFEATLAVLVVACPCAFAIATPAAVSAVTAHLARRGILVVRIDSLEVLSRVDRFVVDKTGTLTHGAVAVHRTVTSGDLSEARCLAIAGALETASEHPLARAFAAHANRTQATDVRTFPGAGLEGSVDGRRYRIGTAAFVAELRGAKNSSEQLVPETGTVVTLGDEHRARASFEIRDRLRSSAASFVATARNMQIGTEISSGDSSSAVAEIAARAGIDEYRARCTPEEKLARVRDLQSQGHRVAMVGDGVNDAPVLAAADVSIAMGRGAALAHAGADLILMSDDLNRLPQAVRLVRKALRIAAQNMRWSALYNLGSLPLAAAGLLSPWAAALGMSLSSIAVVLNAARLLPGRSKSS